MSTDFFERHAKFILRDSTIVFKAIKFNYLPIRNKSSKLLLIYLISRYAGWFWSKIILYHKISLSVCEYVSVYVGPE